MNTTDIQELETQGRVYVPYSPELRAGVEEAVQAWQAFCALPKETKLGFPYDPDVKVSGNGYEYKDDPATGDLKEDFHFRLNAAESLMRSARTVDEIVAPAFIEKALGVNELIGPLVRDFASAVERTYGIEGFADDVMVMQPSWILRFLHYFGDREPGAEIAAPHVDKGGFTLHLFESDGGVEQLTYDERVWKPMPVSHTETVIIPAMGLQNRSRGKLRATCHRVVATPESAVEGRYSMVCFFDFRNARYYDKKTHGRLQEWAPGAFYDMPFAEFDKLFTD